MRPTNILALALGLATPIAQAAVFMAFPDNNCAGNGQEVNVWDNTCAEWPNNFRSVRVLGYGGRAQRLNFETGVCWSGGGPSYWADGGGNDGWTVGNCLNMGVTCTTVMSWHGA